jgi:hypothetical protein
MDGTLFRERDQVLVVRLVGALLAAGGLRSGA